MQRILIVEDDENLREEVKIFLNHNGYEAECLECFHHTVQDILERKPDKKEKVGIRKEIPIFLIL